jgi:hexosaminidase
VRIVHLAKDVYRSAASRCREEYPMADDGDDDENEEGGSGGESPTMISVTAPSSPVKLSCPGLTSDEAARVLGSQANLWTEYVPDENTAEYMLLPRLLAMAEALW